MCFLDEPEQDKHSRPLFFQQEVRMYIYVHMYGMYRGYVLSELLVHATKGTCSYVTSC